MTIHDENTSAQPEGSPTAGVTPAARLGHDLRGLLLGLAYGEARAIARLNHRPTPQHAGVATQLAAFTAEALVRAVAHLDTSRHEAVTDALWNGLARWAATQGVAPALTGLYRDLCDTQFPDGWLAAVPAMRQRRGTAPTTVRALEGAVPGTPAAPVTTSGGGHGLLRSLPVAALAALGDPGFVAQKAFESTYLTHGDAHAAHATVLLVSAVGHSIATHEGLAAAVEFGLELVKDTAPPLVRDRVHAAMIASTAVPGNPSQLRRLAPDRTALSVVAGALYAVGAGDLDDVIALVSRGARDVTATAALAGALHGVLGGADALSPAQVAPLELAWPLEVLARDLALQLTEYPAGGSGHAAFADWSTRYPTW